MFWQVYPVSSFRSAHCFASAPIESAPIAFLTGTPPELDAFCDIYMATMDRNEAQTVYCFRRDFFQTIISALPDNHILVHVRAPDGIFNYKASFAPDGEVMFEVGERVFSDEACRRLVIQRAAWERAQGHDWAPGQGFFPAYRA